jgi:hypothetical protein
VPGTDMMNGGRKFYVSASERRRTKPSAIRGS